MVCVRLHFEVKRFKSRTCFTLEKLVKQIIIVDFLMDFCVSLNRLKEKIYFHIFFFFLCPETPRIRMKLFQRKRFLAKCFVSLPEYLKPWISFSNFLLFHSRPATYFIGWFSNSVYNPPTQLDLVFFKTKLKCVMRPLLEISQKSF